MLVTVPNKLTLCVLVVVAALLGGCESAPPALKMDSSRAAMDAQWTLLKSADDRDVVTRCQAIEALAQTTGSANGQIYLQGLSDKAPLVRFASALAVGESRYEPARKQLLKMAKDGEPDKRVYIGVIYALYRLGDTAHARDLGKLLFDQEKEVRANAALVMGRMKEPAAIRPLKALQSTEQDGMVYIQTTESLAMLGDERSLVLLEGGAKAVFLDERLVAIPALANVRARRAVHLIRGMVDSSEPPRIRLAAAGALAQLGEYNKGAYDFCLLALKDPNKVLRDIYGPGVAIQVEEASSTQTLAAISLGHMGNIAAIDEMHPLLNSADGSVRVAAAMGILRLLPAHAKPQAAVVPEAAAVPAGPQTQPAKPNVPAQAAPATKPAQVPPPAAAPVKRPGLMTAGAKD